MGNDQGSPLFYDYLINLVKDNDGFGPCMSSKTMFQNP